ncbi:DUF6705 family protein [Bizionia myxarmorum]|uniref:DUF6705 domain-containing protein n=1 Tax=Bizionia myxarmorum TaxID=291186 RepID=A0A5D0RDS1_9FLAO|nr:DUF6705 family protein [Bizionia myxarmorum]TYB78915.1 hypothetical protein ES674_03835 [Bizionia myxarmorum]
MKTPIYIAILSFFSVLIECKAQTPVVSLYEGNLVPRLENAYYKDVDNDFNRFIGTWRYTNGNEIFKIVLNKMQMSELTRVSGISYFTDYLYGEFQYIDNNGNELINTLPEISNTSLSKDEHQIFGNRIIPYQFLPNCEDCVVGERRVRLRLEDPERTYLSYEIVLRTLPNITDPTINDIEMVLGLGYSRFPSGATTETRIPYGTYVMIKQ